MQSSLVKGIGPQDHCAIGRAAELPGKATGQYLSMSPIAIPLEGRPVELHVRVTVPIVGREKLPIILLSHGMGPSNNLSSLNGYLPMSQFYAAHGFAVVQPTHLGSRSLSLDDKTPGGLAYERWRVLDMKAILDNLDVIEAAVPILHAGRLDRSRVAVWGHSMGSHTAGALLGQRWMDSVDPTLEVDAFEPRVKAGILVGAIGRGGDALFEAMGNNYAFMKTPKFEYIKTQTLVVNGDADAAGHFTDMGYMWHADAYTLGGGGPKDLITMSGGNHSFGGISGWDSTDCALFKEESPMMVAAVQRMTLAYLRSKLYGDNSDWDKACRALKETDLGTHESK